MDDEEPFYWVQQDVQVQAQVQAQVQGQVQGQVHVPMHEPVVVDPDDTGMDEDLEI